MNEVTETTPAAFGSTSPEIEESERLLREKRDGKAPAASLSVAPGSPAAPSPKKKPTAKKASEPTPEDVKGFSTFFTETVGLFLPKKAPATPEERQLLDEGARGTFKKYPQIFAWFPVLTLLAGMVLFVINRMRKKTDESGKPMVFVDSGHDRKREVMQDGTNDTTGKTGANIRPESRV